MLHPDLSSFELAPATLSVVADPTFVSVADPGIESRPTPWCSGDGESSPRDPKMWEKWAGGRRQNVRRMSFDPYSSSFNSYRFVPPSTESLIDPGTGKSDLYIYLPRDHPRISEVPAQRQDISTAHFSRKCTVIRWNRIQRIQSISQTRAPFWCLLGVFGSKRFSRFLQLQMKFNRYIRLAEWSLFYFSWSCDVGKKVPLCTVHRNCKKHCFPKRRLPFVYRKTLNIINDINVTTCRMCPKCQRHLPTEMTSF